MEDENIVYVGRKPTMNYVLAVMHQLKEMQHTKIKARGRSISKAVDIAEIIRNKYAKSATASVVIGTEKIEKDGKANNLSTIEIELTK